MRRYGVRGTGQRIPSDVSLWSGIPRSGEVDSHFGSDEMGHRGCSHRAWDLTLVRDTYCLMRSRFLGM